MQGEPHESTEGTAAPLVTAASHIDIENGERMRAVATRQNAIPSSNQIQMDLLQGLSQETINKVSRLVAMRLMWGAAGAFIANEIRLAHEVRTKLRAGVPNQMKTKGDDEVLAGKLRLIELRIATWQAQQDDIAAKRSAAIAVADSLLKTVRQELGGGVYGEEIFDLLGWRNH